jgi:hypothetical protein
VEFGKLKFVKSLQMNFLDTPKANGMPWCNFPVECKKLDEFRMCILSIFIKLKSVVPEE